jgi:hypothetical protein
VTVIADLISRESRARLLGRVRELDQLDELMRQPGTLAEPDEPVPLHRAGRDTVTNSTKFSTNLTERTTQ